MLKSFRQGDEALNNLLQLNLGHKQLERLTERIGAARLLEVQQEVDSFRALKLMDKAEPQPTGSSPKCVAIMADGGRYQRNELNPEADSPKNKKTSHWFEFKAGLCLELAGRHDGIEPGLDAPDPLPEVPEFLLNLQKAEKLTREMGKKAADVVSVVPDPLDTIDLQDKTLADLEGMVAKTLNNTSEARRAQQCLSPQVKSRDVVATTQDCYALGWQLVARAWRLGAFRAKIRAFVGDGSSWIWGIYERHFKNYGFTAIVDIIHAVTYLYAAAMADRPQDVGGPVYQRWVSWLWNGEVSRVIAELAERQQELGLPRPDDGETSPRTIVSKALTYFQNQHSRMDYPSYRKQGMPITSSHMESAIKELNYRIKGTEKFWTADGGGAVLQLKADQLSDSAPLEKFWEQRRQTRTGLRSSAGKRKHKAEAGATSA